MANRLDETNLSQEVKRTEETPQVEKPVKEDEKEYQELAEKAAVDPASLSAKDLDNFYSWKKKQTKKDLEAQPKLPLFIPFREGEDRNNKGNVYHPFEINGYLIYVRKGRVVDVPKQLVEMWNESQIEGETSQEWSLGNIANKIDPITGKQKSIDMVID